VFGLFNEQRLNDRAKEYYCFSLEKARTVRMLDIHSSAVADAFASSSWNCVTISPP